MTIEEQLKQEILSRYKSIRSFTTAIGIPYSTLDSVFKRGISNAGVSTMIKIFNALDLDVESIKDETLKSKLVYKKTAPPYSDEAMQLAKDYDDLDGHGQRVVRLLPDQDNVPIVDDRLHAGDIILVRQQPSVDIGEIGLFTVGDKGFVKKQGEHELISVNDEFENIVPSEYDTFFCRGKVVGVLDPDWIVER